MNFNAVKKLVDNFTGIMCLIENKEKRPYEWD